MKIISRLIYFAMMITIISIALFFNQKKADAAEESIIDHDHDFLIIEAEDIAELNKLIGNKTISRVLGLDTEEFNRPGQALKIGINNEDGAHTKLIDRTLP